MTEKSYSMKHARENSEIDGDRAIVRFSSGVLRSLGELDTALRDSPNFDPDLSRNLRDLAGGKGPSVRGAISNIGLIFQGAAEALQKTDHEEERTAIKLALLSLSDQLIGAKSNSKPVTVVDPREMGR